MVHTSLIAHSTMMLLCIYLLLVSACTSEASGGLGGRSLGFYEENFQTFDPMGRTYTATLAKGYNPPICGADGPELLCSYVYEALRRERTRLFVKGWKT